MSILVTVPEEEVNVMTPTPGRTQVLKVNSMLVSAVTGFSGVPGPSGYLATIAGMVVSFG